MKKKFELIEIGFKAYKHYTIMDSVYYDLGRSRVLEIGDIGTPNEMIVIKEMQEKVCTDIVVLRNWDYDGETSIEQIKQLINLIGDESIHIK